MTLALGIMASGTGSNAQAIIEAINKGRLDAEVRLVFSNKPESKVLERARAANIPYASLDHKAYKDRESFDRDVVDLLQNAGVDTIAMAGYMRLVTPPFLEAFPQRVLNMHPAILPAFAGAHGIADTLAWGVRIAGCTVHFVDNIMDHGPVIIQAAVPSVPGESHEALAARIHACEHKIYPQALSWLAQNRLRITGKEQRFVELLPRQGSSPEGEIQAQATASADYFIVPPLEA